MNNKTNITNNKGMESLYFLIPLFFVVINIIPLVFRIKLNFDLSKKQLIASIFLWKIKLKLLRIIYKDNKIYIITKKHKKEIELNISMKQIYFIDQFVENLKDKIKLKKCCLYAKIGLGDAYQTAKICGYLTVITKCLFCYTKNCKPTSSFEYSIYPKYNSAECFVDSYISLKITLFDIVYSLIISLFSLRSKAYERAKRKEKFS